MKRGLGILATAVCFVTAASSAFAHHSHPLFYDLCKSFTIEGRIERVQYKNPHSILVEESFKWAQKPQDPASCAGR